MVQIAAALGCADVTLIRKFKRDGLWPVVQAARKGEIIADEGTTEVLGGRDRVVESTDPAEWGDIRRLLADRGLRLDEWIVRGARVNEWGDTDAPQTQLRVDVTPRVGAVIRPADEKGWRRPNIPAKPERCKPRTIAVFADHHVPFQDKALHQAALRWLKDHKPDEALILGDLLDLAEVSRHRKRPEFATQLNDTVDAGYGLLRDYVTASPSTSFTMLAGNHEDRIRNAVLENLTALHGVRRAKTDDDPDPEGVLSIPHLLRLGNLGIEYAAADGEYHRGQIVLTDSLIARHGWLSRPGAAASAHATVTALNFSCVVGHVHRRGITHVTRHDPVTGEWRELLGVEPGTMAHIGRDSGHTAYIASGAPDWQPGWGVIRVHGSGLETAEVVVWDGEAAYHGDWSCKP